MGKVMSIPQEERPREKGLRYGVEALSNRELLAILIRCGTKEHSALEVADSVLAKAEGICGLGSLDIAELDAIPGISQVKALEILSSLELARRVAFEKTLSQDVVRSPETVYDWLQQKIGAEEHERFMVLFLDTANHILKAETLFIGTTQSSLVSPKDIMRQAVKYACMSVILVHNHPGGTLQPSKEDMEMTRRIIMSGLLLGVKVVDHIIVTRNGCMSFARQGLIEALTPGR